MPQIAPTTFQTAVLRFRNHCNILSAGGRGSGKTTALLLDVVGHCLDFGPEAKPLVTREGWQGLSQIMDTLYEYCVAAWGASVDRNKHDACIRLPTGGTIYFTDVSDEQSYAKHQGKSYTALYADECGNYSPTAYAFLKRIMSNLRCSPGRRTHCHWTANPHGKCHTVLFKEFVSKAPPWHPFSDAVGNLWLWTTSDLSMNPHIDQVSYERNIRAASGSDAKLADAWLRGDWSVLGGVMFDEFDPATHIVKAPPYLDARYLMGGDYGSAAPSVVHLIGRLRRPMGRFRQGDYIVLDEIHTADPSDLSVGLGYPPSTLADLCKEMLARNGLKDRQALLVIDDARGLQGETVVGIMRECGLNAMKPHRKDRCGTWELIRQLLHNSRQGAEKQGLWFTDRCHYLLETLPEAPRDTFRASDIDHKYNKDHALDALGYGLMAMQNMTVRGGRVIGVPS